MTLHSGTYRPYRPSNGTEGDMFMSEWCEHCIHSDREEGDGCMIQLAALVHRVDEPEYPDEWNYSNGGIPQCTAFTVDRDAEPRCALTPDMFDKI